MALISYLPLDLSSFESVKAAVERFKATESRLDILINIAGIMMTPEGLTNEGYEIQFGTNHMGHAMLIQLLLPILQQTFRATILEMTMPCVISNMPTKPYVLPVFDASTPPANTGLGKEGDDDGKSIAREYLQDE